MLNEYLQVFNLNWRYNIKAIPKGTVFPITEGSYSDYYIRGLFTALKDIDPKAVQEEYLKAYPLDPEEYWDGSDKVVDFLINQGYVSQLPYCYMHLGDFGEPSFSARIPD